MEHYSVLLQESIDLLNIRKDGVYVDCTLGRGGHSEKILEKLTSGRLIAFDKDAEAIAYCREKFKNYTNCELIHSDFRFLKRELELRGVEKVDGILMDLGVSSPQFDDPERGFSYRYDSRLDMRMDQNQSLSAYEVVNEYPEGDLIRILREYGEEKNARSIARSIVENRPITTTLQLVDVIKKALPQKVLHKDKHPAKQTFQAIRIEVNDELNSLREVLQQAIQLLDEEGCLAVISFHSLEDRIVKQTMNGFVKVDRADKRIPLLPSEVPTSDYELLTKKPIEAGEGELAENNRSHSAKLRGIRRKKAWRSEREKSEG